MLFTIKRFIRKKKYVQFLWRILGKKLTLNQKARSSSLFAYVAGLDVPPHPKSNVALLGCLWVASTIFFLRTNPGTFALQESTACLAVEAKMQQLISVTFGCGRLKNLAFLLPSRRYPKLPPCRATNVWNVLLLCVHKSYPFYTLPGGVPIILSHPSWNV